MSEEERYLKRAVEHLERAIYYLKKAEATRLVKTVDSVVKEIEEGIEE